MSTQTPLRQLKILMPLLLPSEAASCNDHCLEILSKSDWIPLAEQFNLSPAFWASLRERKLLLELSPSVRETLERAYEKNSVRQMIFDTLLARILDVLQSLSTPPILLKGLAYVYDLYPDPNVRVMSDIDLMIEPEEKDIALEKLIHEGFIRVPPLPPRVRLIDKLVRNINLESMYQQITHRTKGPSRSGETWLKTIIGGMEIIVDIHHILFNIRPLIKEKIFHTDPGFDGRTRSLSLKAGRVQVIDYESAFLYAVRHLALHHQLIGFRWHYDLALMLLLWRDYLNPESILEQARSLGSHKMVRVELALLEELFGPAILRAEDRERWLIERLPVGYSVCRRVALRGLHTPMWKLIRPLLAPTFKEQIIVSFS